MAKTQITNALTEISKDETDPRSAQALYELAVCGASGFGAIERDWHFYMLSSAERGHIAAQACLYRLCPKDALPTESQLGKWLCNAADKGYQIALDDLAILDQGAYRHCITSLAVAFCNAQDGNELHTAIAMDLIRDPDDLNSLMSQHGIGINDTMANGDTALLLGCRFGHYETVKALLQLPDIDVNCNTNHNENASHFVWCFRDVTEANSIATALHEKGIQWDCQATADSSRPLSLDPLPHLPGLSVERIAARGRLGLLQHIIELGALQRTPTNGNLVRKMLVWATRLHSPKIRNYLYELAQSGLRQDGRRVSYNSRLAPIEDTRWEYQKKWLDIEDGLLLGWVSPFGDAWDTPIEFWRLCALNDNPELAVKEIVSGRDFNLNKNTEAKFLRAIAADDKTFVKIALDSIGPAGEPGSFLEPLSRREVATQQRGRETNEVDSYALSDIRLREEFIENRETFSLKWQSQFPYGSCGRSWFRSIVAREALFWGSRGIFEAVCESYGDYECQCCINRIPSSEEPIKFADLVLGRNTIHILSALARTLHQDLWFA